ncbi:MAG: LysM peptidoglycan-binding domain-containing protein [Firmicutes bacterium]|nr:LysM peptidoglycan-binding domain-containing protein [Bacillota bacterium]
MSKNSKNTSGTKRAPQLVELAPPRVKSAKPAVSTRKLSPLPELKTNDPDITSKSHTKKRVPEQPTSQRRQLDDLSVNLQSPGRRPLPVTGTRLGRDTKPRQEYKPPKRGMSPKVRQGLNIGVIVVIFGTLFILLGIRLFSHNALAVYMDGRPVGHIPMNRETTSESFQTELIAHLENNHRTEVILTQQVTVEPSRWAPGRNVIERSSMISNLGLHIGYEINVRAVYINGQLEVVVRSDDCIRDIENRIQAEWINENTVYSRFATEWQVVNKNVERDYEGILTPSQAIIILDRTEMVNYQYTVVSGDRLEHIATRFGTTAENIANTNNITLGTTIHPGDVLTVRTRMPILSVITIDEIATYSIIEMPAETTYTDERDESTTYVVQEGSPGEMRTVERITRLNGIVTDTEQLGAVIIQEPVTRIVEIGTRAVPIERR